MIVLLLAIHPEIALGAWEQFARVIGLAGEPVPASPAVLSEHEVEEIEGLPPQEQVMRLLPRATNHYQGAIELIERKVDGWHGNEPGTDDTTRGFVFHALRDITGRSFGKDPAAWRVWWDQSH